ncbi:MAG: hypothetical protein FJ312_04955, partial [SAR202 cluster bacterium]|nr:hypothetical protein [SAR202 cluster bacterium]
MEGRPQRSGAPLAAQAQALRAALDGMRCWFDIFETESGWVGIVASERGVRRATLPQPSPDQCVAELGAEFDGADPSSGRLAALRRRVQRYFAGERVDFDEVPLDVD